MVSTPVVRLGDAFLFHIGRSDDATCIIPVQKGTGLVVGTTWVIEKKHRVNLDFYNYADSFQVTVSEYPAKGISLVIRRIDSECGWWMNLSFLVKQQAVMESYAARQFLIEGAITEVEGLVDENAAHGPIPRVLYQLTRDRSTVPAYIYKQWLSQTGWEYRILDDAMMLETVNAIAGPFYETLVRLCLDFQGAYAADFARYLLILANGGVYMDIKTLVHSNCDSLVDALFGLPRGCLITSIGLDRRCCFNGILAAPRGTAVLFRTICAALKIWSNRLWVGDYLCIVNSFADTISESIHMPFADLVDTPLDDIRDESGLTFKFLREDHDRIANPTGDRYGAQLSHFMSSRPVLRVRDPDYQSKWS